MCKGGGPLKLWIRAIQSFVGDSLKLNDLKDGKPVQTENYYCKSIGFLCKGFHLELPILQLVHHLILSLRIEDLWYMTLMQ